MVSGSEIEQCYGKFRIEDRTDQCKKRGQCPWGEACLSRANENADTVHYHLANVSVGLMLYDPNRDSSADDFIGAAECDGGDRSEVSAANAVLSACADDSAAEDGDIVLETATIPGEQYDAVKQALERIADLYFNTPNAFDMLMKRIFKGYNQSEAAKEKGITRQGLNKRLLYELGIAQKRNDIQHRRDKELARVKRDYENAVREVKARADAIKDMTDTERLVYKICAEDGCLSVSSAARLTGFSRPTVYSALHNLREKYGITLHMCRSPRKKNQKNDENYC